MQQFFINSLKHGRVIVIVLVVMKYPRDQCVMGSLIPAAQQRQKRCILGAAPGGLHPHTRPRTIRSRIDKERIATGEIRTDPFKAVELTTVEPRKAKNLRVVDRAVRSWVSAVRLGRMEAMGMFTTV